MAITAAADVTKLRVVLADDTPDVRELMRLILEREDDFAVVAEAGDGMEAARACEIERPQLILLDLAMPVMDGLEAIRKIRQVSPATNIVVLSGFEASKAAKEALELGASAYLPKGTPPADIVVKLRQVAARGGRDVVPLFGDGAPAAPRRHLQRRWEDLVPMLTHELRNQVLVIEGFSSMMIERWDAVSAEEKLEFMHRVDRNARQMHALIDAFSEADKIGSEDLELTRVPTRVAGLVGEVAGDLFSLSDSHHVKISVEREVVVELDPVRVRQILTNLLSNAAKFSPAGSIIHVAVAVNRTYVEVQVVDEGPGIPVARRDELFRPFSRLGAKAVDGTGLGLYISRGLARAHGGDLLLAPSAHGACFVLMLPLS